MSIRVALWSSVFIRLTITGFFFDCTVFCIPSSGKTLFTSAPWFGATLFGCGSGALGEREQG